MRPPSLRAFLLSALLCLAPFTTPGRAGPGDEADAIMERIRAKAQMGQTTEVQLARELNQLSDLQIKYRGQRSVAAEMLLTRAFVYAQVIKDQKMALMLFEQVATEYPGTPAAGLAAETVDAARESADDAPPRPTHSAGPARERPSSASSTARTTSGASSRVSTSAPEKGAPWPDFNVQDLDGAPLSVAQFRGKVVLVDFWATWCGPCIDEMDDLMATYRRYFDKGFEIVGISQDKDRAPLVNFVRRRMITWPQYYDEGGQLSRRYGVSSIPKTYLIDAEGIVIGVDLRGAALERALQKALDR